MFECMNADISKVYAVMSRNWLYTNVHLYSRKTGGRTGPISNHMHRYYPCITGLNLLVLGTLLYRLLCIGNLQQATVSLSQQGGGGNAIVEVTENR